MPPEIFLGITVRLLKFVNMRNDCQRLTLSCGSEPDNIAIYLNLHPENGKRAVLNERLRLAIRYIVVIEAFQYRLTCKMNDR
jgi:hypothetical protein